MATVRIDIADFINDGYEFPATGGTLEIYCEENSSEIYSIVIGLLNNSENIISDVTVEDSIGSAGVSYDDSGMVWLVSDLSPYDYFTISITVPANETTNTFTGEADFLDTNGDLIAAPSLSQEAGSSPAPVWEEGQHKIYRSGNQVMKMYRSGELIYLRLNPSSEEPPAPPTPTENWVDLTTIDNNTPIYNIAWLTDQGFSTINDTWFSEAPGLVTDSSVDEGTGWSYGKTQDKGYYTYHRMSNTHKKYSCTFLDQYYTGNGETVAYGVAMSDASINQLPTGTINGNTYYMLNIVDWQNWKPLYMPLSTSKIQSTYVEGKILVDIAPKT